MGAAEAELAVSFLGYKFPTRWLFVVEPTLEEIMRKKIRTIGAMLVAAAMLCAVPISLDQSGLSLSVDQARACDR